MNAHQEYKIKQQYNELIASRWSLQTQHMNDYDRINAALWIEGTSGINPSRRFNIDMVSKIYEKLHCKNMVGINPVVEWSSDLFYRRCNLNGSWVRKEETDITTEEVGSHTSLNFDGKEDTSLLEDAVATEIATDIDRHVIDTIRKIARTNHTCKLEGKTTTERCRSMISHIDCLCNEVSNLIGQRPNWMIASTNTLNFLSLCPDFNYEPDSGLSYGIHRVGNMLGMSVYQDWDFHNLCVGYFEPPLKSGLFYCPSAIKETKVAMQDGYIIDPRIHSNQRTCFSRLEALRLVPHGEDFYGALHGA